MDSRRKIEQVHDLCHPSSGHVPESREVGVVAELAPVHHALELEGEGHQPGDPRSSRPAYGRRDRVEPGFAAFAATGVSPAGAWSELQDALTKSSPKQDKIIRWVESGGNVHWTCAEGMTLLHYAAMQDNERMTRFLLDHRANVNAEAKFKMTPLLWACKSISTSVVPLLLDRGANPNAQANDGHTALQFIRHSGLTLHSLYLKFSHLSGLDTPEVDFGVNGSRLGGNGFRRRRQHR